MNTRNGNANSVAQNFVALGDFNSDQKKTWYSSLYATNVAGSTPLVAALDRAGRYFETGTMPGAKATSRSVTVPLACTPNYTILSTDGYWNVNQVEAVGDQDAIVPTLPANIYVNNETKLPVNDPIAGVPLTPGQRFPAPFYDGHGGSDGLADVAMKYWITDLAGNSAGKVTPNASDPATWQHMVTYTIGLGAAGTLSAPPSGTDSWPLPVADGSTTIDDLWHAAINGHGRYFSTNDPMQLKSAFVSILGDILNRSGAAASVAVSNPNVRPDDNNAFASSFNSGGWYGDLQAFAINTASGELSVDPLWSAQALLDKKALANRYIGSFNGTSGVPFTAAGLDAKRARLNSPNTPPGPSDNANVIAYLRGDRANEGSSSDATKPYRGRIHLLGDIVNAEPAYVPPPRASYTDAGYSAFKGGTAKNRAKVVYQGANDGMLHAFDATTGNELWAYVPGSLLDTPLSDTETSTSALVGLTQQGNFRHRYYVDGTPSATDVDLKNTHTVQPTATAASTKATEPDEPTPKAYDWASVLIGGLAKGGRGYYALNVTDPAARSNAAVARKVMWEFPNAGTPAADRNNIGYTYGTPVTVKTKAAGWVTLVSSGYNNGATTGGDGQGHLYVLNTATGAVIKDLGTGAGTSASPSGLAKVSAFLMNPGVDDTADYAYGGDLLGNVWRFDLSGATVADWNVRLLASLVDASGAAQPVTGAPELGVLGGKRMVYVGTGQYLGNSDVPGNGTANASATQPQSFYGLLDDRSDDPKIADLRASLVQLKASEADANGDIKVAIDQQPADRRTPRGWVLDFAATAIGERAYTSPVLFQGVLMFTTNIPSGDACTPGGRSNIYFLDYGTGGDIANLSSRVVGNVLSSRVQPVVLPDGTVKTIVRTSDGKTRNYDVAVPSATQPTRIMWREVIRK